MQVKSSIALGRGLVLEPDMCSDRCLHTSPECDGQSGRYRFHPRRTSPEGGAECSLVSDLVSTMGIQAEVSAESQGDRYCFSLCARATISSVSPFLSGLLTPVTQG